MCLRRYTCPNPCQITQPGVFCTPFCPLLYTLSCLASLAVQQRAWRVAQFPRLRRHSHTFVRNAQQCDSLFVASDRGRLQPPPAPPAQYRQPPPWWPPPPQQYVMMPRLAPPPPPVQQVLPVQYYAAPGMHLPGAPHSYPGDGLFPLHPACGCHCGRATFPTAGIGDFMHNMRI